MYNNNNLWEGRMFATNVLYAILMAGIKFGYKILITLSDLGSCIGKCIYCPPLANKITHKLNFQNS